ncbi:zinc finger protein 26-like isoform X2 [Bombyx mandarina]|uniref:Zinc finger protein 26-like isoform X1 n=1 Tax=Bombyx mandarina TaxID=7092 RepID=A0A6J2KGU6_BOMMA|nr:zinc finger protein 26-like isoform X1 [Bombyx mandarina]XP_028041255.1 zinc finger protein 26-like isoform X2 [Bombyx mandarina]
MMEFDDIVVKENPGLCRCCLSEGCYKDLGSEYTWMNENEVYADMLLECFDISISQINEGPNGPNRLICEVCITRLRDACNFKKQVFECEKKFIDMVARGEFRKVLIYQAHMKSEEVGPEDEIQADESEYLEEDPDFGDDEPLKREEPQPTVSAEPLQIKGKRGRPKKQPDAKPEKKKSNTDDKKTKPVAKDVKTRKYKGCESSSMRRRRNFEILFNNTTIIPFKWRGKYLCFYCSKDIAEYNELRKHTKSHGDCSIKDHSLKVLKGGHNMEIKIDVSDVACEICGEPFPSLEEIINHLYVKHKLEYDRGVEMSIEEYRLVDMGCLVCGEKFAFFGYLVSHVNNTHPKNCLLCDKCNQKFNKKRDLFSHMKNYHREGGYQCEVCPQSFSSLNILRKHKINRHLTRCSVCHLKLPSASLKQKHMDLEHPDDGSLQCDNCDKQFHTKQGLRMHSRKCKGLEEFLEIAYKKEDAAAMDLDQNYEERSKRPSVKQIRENIVIVINMSTAIPFNFYKNKFNCFYCSKDFADSDAMREHTVVEHPVCDVKEKCIRKCRESVACVKIDISTLACKICFESMINLDSLIDHLIVKHEANYDKSITTCLQPYRLVKDHMACPNCPGEVFRFFGTLLKHMNKKHTNNNIICVYCGETFRRDQNLRVHVWRHHRDGRFKCNICGAECNIPSRLYMHMAKAHGVRASKCPKCPESFATQYLRQKHLIDAHDSGHKCTYCGKLFTRNSFMRDHVRRTHLKEKNVECSICNMKFFNNILLRRHMVKHSGEKNFHCEICGERFFWRKSLRTHMARHSRHLNPAQV